MSGILKYPILVHSTMEKKEKYRWPNGAHQKKIFKKTKNNAFNSR